MKKITLILVTLFILVQSHAQTISVSVPKTVSVGENFRLSYTVYQQTVKDIKLGDIPKELELLTEQPYSSNQSSVSIINGKMSSSSSATYTYTLYASKVGTYNIGSAKIIVNGKVLISKPVKIVVLKGATNSSQRKTIDDIQPIGSKITNRDLFLKVSANKRTVYEQEGILLTYKVYSLVEVTSLDGKIPELTGIHTQEVPLPQQKSFHIESVNGRPYRCVTWSQYIVFPQITGKQKIPSISFKARVPQRRMSVDPIEEFLNGGSNFDEVEKVIKSPTLDLTVLPLPKAPQSFSGGVGHFAISANLIGKGSKVGDALTLQVRVKGNGNLKLLKQPKVDFPTEFDKYDPKVIDKTKVTSNGVEGEMIYEFVAIPTKQGRYSIPPIRFTYFDTTLKQYKTISTNSMSLDVKKGRYNRNSIDKYSEQQDTDIRDIKNGVNLGINANDILFGTLTYWTVLFFLFGIGIAGQILFSQKTKGLFNVTNNKEKRANKEAVKRLKKALTLMSDNISDAFYDEVLRALWEYLGDKLNISITSLNRENIVDKLSNNKIAENVIKDVIAALDECEYARYAPGDIVGNMDKTYNMAKQAIIKIEETINKKKGTINLWTMSVLFLFLCFSSSTFAVTKQQADNFYNNKEYEKAIDAYNTLLKENPSAYLYYNIGNAYYRTNKLSLALVNYERALRLEPNNEDIRFNIDFVNKQTVDKVVESPNNLFTIPYYYIMYCLNIDNWTYISLFTLALCFLGMMGYKIGRNKVEQTMGLYLSLICGLCFIFSTLFALHLKNKINSKDEAIIVSPTINIKRTPEANSATDFTLHEATKVYIIDKDIKGWYEIEIGDGRRGWISSNNIIII